VAVRAAAAVGEALPPPLGGYVQKVRNHAYRVLDDDIDALLGAGYSEQQIFELTQAAAFGAGLVRLEAALAALNQES
jgi:alkylhydroperoxidase family enzyme